MESNSNKTKRTRIVTKPGFIYQVNVDNEFLSFFQLVCEDHTNCNTDVIRVFKRRYPIGSIPKIEDIISDDILFYTHTIVRSGVYKNYWTKYGKSANVGIEKLDSVWFGTVHEQIYDKVTYLVQEVNPLENWQIWRVNDVRYYINKMPNNEILDNMEEGSIYCLESIMSRIKYGYYKSENYIYLALKRIPRDDVSSYVKESTSNGTVYTHFYGSDIVQQILFEKKIKLSVDNPQVGEYSMDKLKFWEKNWDSDNFISKEEFDEVWNSIP